MLEKLKNWLPTKEQIEANPRLKFLNKYMQKYSLFEMSRSSVSKAVFVGIFSAFIPLPLQTLISAVLAVVFRSNIIIALSMVWISNPFTLLPFLYAGYKVGAIILGINNIVDFTEINLDLIMASWHTLFIPILVGSLILGAGLGALCAGLVWIFFSLITKKIN